MSTLSPRPAWRWTAVLLAAPAWLAGCQPSAPAPAAPEAGREVVFPDGSRVRVRSRALRVFPASSSVVDFAAEVAPPERFAAVPEQAFDYSSATGDAAAWEKVPRFSAYVAETVLARSPDLVIAEPWQDENTSARLREAGIEVVVLPEVRTWQEARATLVAVGDLLGLREEAEEVARELDQRVANLAASAGARQGLRAVVYSNFGTGGSSAGSGTTIHEQIVLAGLKNAFAENGREGHAAITFEELIVLDPDLILVSQPLRGGDSTQGDFGGASAKLLLSEPGLRGLRAVRERRIVELPPFLFATGSHQLVRGAEVLAESVDALLAHLPPAEARR